MCTFCQIESAYIWQVSLKGSRLTHELTCLPLNHRSIIVLSERAYYSFTSFISPWHHALTQDVFHGGSEELHSQRYSRTKVRDLIMQVSLNSQLFMTVLMLFLLKSFMNMKIKSWLKLMSEQCEQCIMKLQYESHWLIFICLHHVIVLTTQSNLMCQRDEMAQSIVMNTNLLKNRLK